MARSVCLKRPFLFVLLVLFSSLVTIIQLQKNSNTRLFLKQRRKESVTVKINSGLLAREKQQQRPKEHPLSLTNGDLPGYTGWSRPFETLAGSFDAPMLLEEDEGPVVGKNFTVRIQCNTNSISNGECQKGRSLFYVRAYGRTILPGRVTNYKNGTYDISIFAMDPGTYHLEVVLGERTSVHGLAHFE